MYAEKFSEKLKIARKNTGFNQDEVAKEIHIHQGTLSSYEKGRTQPDIETLGRLADFYQVSTDWLIGTTSTSKPIQMQTAYITQTKCAKNKNEIILEIKLQAT
jgi:transcriptional regulator with XRE-family HTH domain